MSWNKNSEQKAKWMRDKRTWCDSERLAMTNKSRWLWYEWRKLYSISFREGKHWMMARLKKSRMRFNKNRVTTQWYPLLHKAQINLGNNSQMRCRNWPFASCLRGRVRNKAICQNRYLNIRTVALQFLSYRHNLGVLVFGNHFAWQLPFELLGWRANQSGSHQKQQTTSKKRRYHYRKQWCENIEVHT